MSSRAEAPAELDAIVARCLARKPADRFSDVDELAAALDHVLGGDDDQTRIRIGAAPPRNTTARMDAMPEDATWIDSAPEPRSKPKFLPTTTLPGVVPPPKKR